jgi:predicted phage terminase large subunit-like protein
METGADKYEHQSAAYQYIGWDELVQFEENQYTYLFSRLRRLKDGTVPLRVRSASNPPDRFQRTTGAWVNDYFHVETGGLPDRPFVPAKLDDNPHVDREEYRLSLAHLDPTTRKQLEDGDWSAKEPGEFFKAEWFEIVEAEPASLMQVRRWDLAGTEPKLSQSKSHDPDWTAGARVGKSREGVYYVMDVRRTRSTPGDVEKLVRQTAMMDGVAVPICINQDPGQAGKAQVEHYIMRVLPGWIVYGEQETGDKQLRARPAAAQAQVNNVKLVKGAWTQAFLDELEGFPGTDHDDQVDAFSGAMQVLMRSPYVAPKVLDPPKDLHELRSREFLKHLAKIRAGKNGHESGPQFPAMG